MSVGQHGKGNSSFILLLVSPKTNQTKLKPQDYYLQLVQSQERFTIPLTSQMMKSPKKNITYQRYRFFSYNQSDGQSIGSYATEPRTRADHCDFGDLKDSLIRDKIVIGIRDCKTQERLLRESNLSLDKALQICRASEEVKVQTQEIQGASGGMTNTKVNFVNSKHKYRPQESSAHRPKSTMSRRKTTPASGHKNRCTRCGRLHNKDQRKCPAANQRCHNCGMLGHFAVVCKNKSRVITQ